MGSPRPPRLVDMLLDGLATRHAEGYVRGAPLVQRALLAFGQEPGDHEDDIMRWLSLAWPAAADLWDDEAWHALTTHAVKRARETGALNFLPFSE